jgi:anti-sigma B factor antagonist
MNYSRIDQDSNTIFRVQGELDAISAPELRNELDRLVSDGRQEITVDLSDLKLIDSSGVGALVGLYKRVRAGGGAVRFVGVTAQPLVVFKLLRLDMVFGVQS